MSSSPERSSSSIPGFSRRESDGLEVTQASTTLECISPLLVSCRSFLHQCQNPLFQLRFLHNQFAVELEKLLKAVSTPPATPASPPHEVPESILPTVATAVPGSCDRRSPPRPELEPPRQRARTLQGSEGEEEFVPSPPGAAPSGAQETLPLGQSGIVSPPETRSPTRPKVRVRMIVVPLVGPVRSVHDILVSGQEPIGECCREPPISCLTKSSFLFRLVKP